MKADFHGVFCVYPCVPLSLSEPHFICWESCVKELVGEGALDTIPAILNRPDSPGRPLEHLEPQFPP